MHPDSEEQVLGECYLKRCCAEKHIVVSCACDPDFWEVEALVNPDASCCAIGICPKHAECETHEFCSTGPSGTDGDECTYRWVGQCTSFFVGPNGERARCSSSLDGVADSAVCPECAQMYYPRPVCTQGCGQPRRLSYDGMAGAWMRICPCDDSSSSEEGEEEQGEHTPCGGGKKQKTE